MVPPLPLGNLMVFATPPTWEPDGRRGADVAAPASRFEGALIRLLLLLVSEGR